MILVYITCENSSQAKKIGKHLLKKKLAYCINILPDIHSIYFWPPKTDKIAESKESILIAKTKATNFKKIEKEVLKIHSYDTPCIVAFKLDYFSKKYYNKLCKELN